jgi:hypothetical protein
MKLVGTIVFLLIGLFPAFSQDCNPCVGINKILITSALNSSDTLSQLNAGTQVGIYVRIDDARISGISPDFTRLLEFTDSNKSNLLRKGRMAENVFEGYILRAGDDIERLVNGIDLSSVRISPDGHILYLDIGTLARPSSGSQSMYLEGQLGIDVMTELTKELLVKNVNLSMEEVNEIEVEGHKIQLKYVSTDENGPVTSHIFSYTSDGTVVGVSESAFQSNSDDLANNQLRVSGLENLEMKIEIPNTELREIPFTLSFGLGL